MTETDASDARAERESGAGAVSQPQSTPPAGILIGYARCSTEKQDLTAQRAILRGLGVAEERVYLDHCLTGTNRSRPGLNNALAALREGDTLVVLSVAVQLEQDRPLGAAELGRLAFESAWSQRDKRVISAASYARDPNLEDTNDTLDSSGMHGGDRGDGRLRRRTCGTRITCSDHRTPSGLS